MSPQWKGRRRPCWYPWGRFDARSDEAFTLLDVCVALALSAVVMAVSMRLFTSLWLAQDALLDQAEIDAMWASIHRVVAIDAHGATHSGTLWGTLTLKEADGTEYRYLTNSSQQFIRVRTGGGTAVIATGVQSAGVAIDTGIVTLTVTFRNGETREMSVCTLATAGH